MLTVITKRSVSGVGKERMTIMDIVFCDIDIRCDNAGKAQLLQHTTMKKNKEAIIHFQDNKQTLLLPASQAG